MIISRAMAGGVAANRISNSVMSKAQVQATSNKSPYIEGVASDVEMVAPGHKKFLLEDTQIVDGKFQNPELQAAYDRYSGPQSPEEWLSSSRNMALNKYRGEKFEIIHGEHFDAQYDRTGHQIVVETTAVDKNGKFVRTRLDNIGFDKETGGIIIEEAKAQAQELIEKKDRGPFSNNGKTIYEHIRNFDGL